jgi:hypothetical protein
MQIVSQAKQVLGVVAVVAAAIVLLKVGGLMPRGALAGSVLDWTCAAVACALAGR